MSGKTGTGTTSDRSRSCCRPPGGSERNPEFFRRAYGADQEEFGHLLSLPHAFIFHRDYFEFGEDRARETSTNRW